MKVLESYPWIATTFANVVAESNGEFVNATCPLGPHDTARVRLWISTGKVPGVLCLRCWSGCDNLEILRAVGMGYQHCYPANTDWKTIQQEIVARYPYRDEAGVLLYETVRLEPGRAGRDKDFRQRRPVGSGWDWSLNGARRVLYRLPELLATNPTRVVVICEGEKDVESLTAIGVLATTSVCGARSEWLDDYSRTLAGRDVVVVEDADAAGGRHANEVIGSLVRHAVHSVRTSVLPCKDSTEFLNKLRVRGVKENDDLRWELWAALRGGARWDAT